MGLRGYELKGHNRLRVLPQQALHPLPEAQNFDGLRHFGPGDAHEGSVETEGVDQGFGTRCLDGFCVTVGLPVELQALS